MEEGREHVRTVEGIKEKIREDRGEGGRKTRSEYTNDARMRCAYRFREEHPVHLLIAFPRFPSYRFSIPSFQLGASIFGIIIRRLRNESHSLFFILLPSRWTCRWYPSNTLALWTACPASPQSFTTTASTSRTTWSP